MCNYNEVNSCQSTYRYTQQFGGVKCRNSGRSPAGMPAVSRMGGEMSEREMPRGRDALFPRLLPVVLVIIVLHGACRCQFIITHTRLVYDLSAVTVCSLLGYGALRNWPDWYRHRRIWGEGHAPSNLAPASSRRGHLALLECKKTF